MTVDRFESRLQVPHRRLRRLLLSQAVVACACLVACNRQADREVAQADPNPAAARASVAAASSAVPRGDLAEREMFHVGTLARDVTARFRKLPTDKKIYFEIPGLSVAGVPMTTYSIEWPDSREPLAAFPNTWLLRSRQGTGLCVATSIGPRSVLTAAHCVDQGVSYKLSQGRGPRLMATCQQMPRYRQLTGDCDPDRRAVDVAVCTLSDPGNFPTPNGGFESIDGAPPSPQRADQVKIMTFPSCGISASPVDVNPIDVDVDSWPGTGSTIASGTSASKMCDGDSGGPWLAQRGSPRLVAIHVCKDGANTSLGVALDHEDVISFLKSQDGAASPICGGSAPPAICR